MVPAPAPQLPFGKAQCQQWPHCISLCYSNSVAEDSPEKKKKKDLLYTALVDLCLGILFWVVTESNVFFMCNDSALYSMHGVTFETV